MNARNSVSPPALGFLTVLDHPQHGLFGGYLLLNLAGRPLEFHCTAPVKPNRAQQILYGPTLEPFLYGEQIGGTLVSQAKTEPLVICTDRAPVLALREFVASPVVLVLAEEGADADTEDSTEAEATLRQPESDAPRQLLRVDKAHRGIHLVSFHLGRNRLAVPERMADDRSRAAERLAELCETFDLSEPFVRIREAIEEAQQGVR